LRNINRTKTKLTFLIIKINKIKQLIEHIVKKYFIIAIFFGGCGCSLAITARLVTEYINPCSSLRLIFSVVFKILL